MIKHIITGLVASAIIIATPISLAKEPEKFKEEIQEDKESLKKYIDKVRDSEEQLRKDREKLREEREKLREKREKRREARREDLSGKLHGKRDQLKERSRAVKKALTDQEDSD